MIDTVIARLEAGETVHMQLLDGERQWWLESPRLDVSDDAMTAVRARIKLVEFQDSLFRLKMNSQTWAMKGRCNDRTRNRRTT